MDDTEVLLIKRFFNINCLEKLQPYLSLIKRYPPEATGEYRKIGSSSFYRIIEFYKFEYKKREGEFWDKLGNLYLVSDKEMALVVSKVDMGYFWLDYVTDIEIKFNVEENRLHVSNDISLQRGIHSRILHQICLMLFVSDFTLERPDVSNELAWKKMIAETENLNNTIPQYSCNKPPP